MFYHAVYMEWSVAEARARFAEVLQATSEEPQVVLSRGRPNAFAEDE